MSLHFVRITSCLLLLVITLTSPCQAYTQVQDADTVRVELSEIQIEAARLAETEASAPFAVSLIARPPEQLMHTPAITLDAVLNNIPGVWINNRENFALGERLTVRGMGWRAAFGVRGIQVLLDGIPLTTPDGQTVMTVVDPSLVRRAEVIRGPASSFWGNASGGTLFLTTTPREQRPVGRVRGTAGSNGLQKSEAEIGTNIGPHRLDFSASRLFQEGYRDHSSAEIWRGGMHGNFVLGSQTSLRLIGAYVDAPRKQHPGGLTLDEARQTPTMANPAFVAANAGKFSRHAQLGGTLSHQVPVGLVTVTTYGMYRNLNNPLTFAFVSFDRLSGGTRVAIQNDESDINWGVGADGSFQRDDRTNHDNVDGQAGSQVFLDQLEHVYMGALFGRTSYNFGPFSVSAGLRYDQLLFTADDRMDREPVDDATGRRVFSAVSPTAGLSYSHANTLFFANFSTAFEAPTTTELVNRPDLQGGFNPEIEPERTVGFEAGTRGVLPASNLFFDIAAFHFNIRDRLIPFQTPEGSNRVFYRNEGVTGHTGLEVYASWQPSTRFQGSAGYAWSNFVFADGEHEGNHVPGIPEHRLTGEIVLSGLHGFRPLARIEYVSDFYVDSANEFENEGYLVGDLQLGHDGFDLGGDVRIHPFLRVNNVFDTAYMGSVTVNASFNRFYEPAAGRTWQGGLSISWR